jgi:hypothetical protein
MRPRRRATTILLVATIAAAGVALAGCGAGPSQPAGLGEPSPEAEAQLLTSDSTSYRNTHVRCFRVEGQWSDACTFQRIWLGVGSDDPLLVIGFRFEGGRAVSSTGTASLDIACADDLRCWVRTLCFATQQCAGENPFDPEADDVAPLRTPAATAERCVSAWNAHGGFTPAELAQAAPVEARAALGRPIYAPHLAGASLGFIAERSEVRSTTTGCVVRFDLGGTGTYAISSEARGAERFWLWQGARDLGPAADDASWNACQREDGTLVLATSCPRVAAVPRAVVDEIERGYVESVADAGGIPYWLGRSFAGARPVPVLPAPRGAESAVEYANAGGVDLLVLTYRPPDRERTTRGVVVARAEPETATVLVVADREVPAEFSQAVYQALRPFVSSDPDAEQLPGDLEEEPTRIDKSAPVVTHWVGPRFEGFEAAVVADAPDGAGVVRYANGDVEWFLVSYTPLPKKHCARIGCASPPPLPRVLERYGEVRDTVLSQPIIVVLTRQPKKIPHGMAIYEALEPLR